MTAKKDDSLTTRTQKLGRAMLERAKEEQQRTSLGEYVYGQISRINGRKQFLEILTQQSKDELRFLDEKLAAIRDGEFHVEPDGKVIFSDPILNKNYK